MTNTSWKSCKRALAPLFGLALVLQGCAAPGGGGFALPGGGRGPLSVWIASGAREIALDSAPMRENEVYSASRGEVRLHAAANETLDLQLVLSSDAPPAGPFEVRVTDLAGAGGRIAADSDIRLFRVGFERVERFGSWYPAHTGRQTTPTLVPNALIPWSAPRGGGPITLNDRRNAIVWIDISTPDSAAPGEYVGRIEVARRGSQATEFACEIHLQVAPVHIPSQVSLPVVCRVDPRDLLTRRLNWPSAPAEETRILPDDPSHAPARALVDATMRLLHAHRATPVLWGSFPKYQVRGERSVEIQWDDYDALVSPWVDGAAFPDHAPSAAWIIPASEDYPDAEQNGGFASPRYARLLSAYLAACRAHFSEKGWLERSVLRVASPSALNQATIDRMRRISGIVRQSEGSAPILAHLPPSSLRGLGWHNAPAIDLPDVSIWAPPAQWVEPQAVRAVQRLGQRFWFMPDRPPYSGSLAVEAPRSDARSISWQAMRYEANGVWVENATRQDQPSPGTGAPLVLAGDDYGLPDEVIPTVRLKALRRGLLDYELLQLLEASGKPLLAQRTSQQIVPWAFEEACLDNLLSCRESGWSRDPYAYGLARDLLLQELSNTVAPTAAGDQAQVRNLADWAQLMNVAQARAVVRGARLVSATGTFEAKLFGEVINSSDATLEGTWAAGAAPAGWTLSSGGNVVAPPRSRRVAPVALKMDTLAYNRDGVQNVPMTFDTRQAGSLATIARLAVVGAPVLEAPPRIDGDLDDWSADLSNAAGDFRLILDPDPGVGRPATLQTRALFGMDEQNLYVAIRCAHPPNEPPVWNANNRIAIDGGVPWGESLVELLLFPSQEASASSDDIYCLQIKPSGLLVARRGPLTDPPMGESRAWESDARISVRQSREEWAVELALPLRSLGRDAMRHRVWGMNVTRLDARRGEYSSWSGARGYAYATERLGNLVLLAP